MLSSTFYEAASNSALGLQGMGQNAFNPNGQRNSSRDSFETNPRDWGPLMRFEHRCFETIWLTPFEATWDGESTEDQTYGMIRRCKSMGELISRSK